MKFLKELGKSILGLLGLVLSIFGIYAYFQKSGSETLEIDNDLKDQESDIDKQIEDKSEESVPADLGDSEIEDYWNE